MNDISECFNNIINTKIWVFIADIGINKYLWLKTIKIPAYLTNQIGRSIHNSMLLEVFLCVYYRDNNNYT